jgi:alpha-galactosidase
MMMWCIGDTWYGDAKMLWGLWRCRDEGWEPRPGFYAWSLLTRHTRRGSTVHPLEMDAAGASAVAFRAPDGVWSLLIVNRARQERKLALRGLKPRSRWLPYLYAEASIPTADRGLLPPGHALTADGRGALKTAMRAQSFLFLTDGDGR